MIKDVGSHSGEQKQRFIPANLMSDFGRMAVLGIADVKNEIMDRGNIVSAMWGLL
jgi:hypothetical protein